MPHQLTVPRGGQADVVREDRGAAHELVAVHGVDTIDDRDGEAAPLREALHHADEVGPLRGRERDAWHVEQGADVLPHEDVLELRGVDLGCPRRIGGDAGHSRYVDLRHLADFFLERHPPQQSLDAGVRYLGAHGAPEHQGNRHQIACVSHSTDPGNNRARQ